MNIVRCLAVVALGAPAFLSCSSSPGGGGGWVDMAMVQCESGKLPTRNLVAGDLTDKKNQADMGAMICGPLGKAFAGEMRCSPNNIGQVKCQ